jgi:hypothetical protein
VKYRKGEDYDELDETERYEDESQVKRSFTLSGPLIDNKDKYKDTTPSEVWDDILQESRDEDTSGGDKGSSEKLKTAVRSVIARRQ